MDSQTTDTERRAVLERELTQLAAELHAGAYRFLTLLAEFDRLGGWVGEGIKSCAHWLGWRCGVGIVSAREKLRVAHAIEELPKVSEALRSGEISYSKARAITRIAKPDNEDFLLDVALNGTTGHIERLVRYARKYGPEEALEQARAQHRDRFVRTWIDSDGAVVLSGRLPAELGAIVMRALDAAVDAAKAASLAKARDGETELEAEATAAAAPPVGHAANRADALVDLAESFLASGYREGNAGERYQVVLHVDVSSEPAASEPAASEPTTSASAPSAEPAPPYIEGVAALADDTARRLACDASLVVMKEREGETIDVGRRTRTIPPAMRRALTHRDGGCVFPGCTAHRFVDAHHIQHWADGGRTALDNLVLLCRYHHRIVHEEGYTIQLNRPRPGSGRRSRRRDGHVKLIRPDGIPMPRSFSLPVPSEGAAAVARGNREAEVIVDGAATRRWGGERMDVTAALTVLGDIARRRSRASPLP